MHTHGHARSTLDLTETTHIQAAMSCLEKTQIGSGNNRRRTENTEELGEMLEALQRKGDALPATL